MEGRSLLHWLALTLLKSASVCACVCVCVNHRHLRTCRGLLGSLMSDHLSAGHFWGVLSSVNFHTRLYAGKAGVDGTLLRRVKFLQMILIAIET